MATAAACAASSTGTTALCKRNAERNLMSQQFLWFETILSRKGIGTFQVSQEKKVQQKLRNGKDRRRECSVCVSASSRTCSAWVARPARHSHAAASAAPAAPPAEKRKVSQLLLCVSRAWLGKLTAFETKCG